MKKWMYATTVVALCGMISCGSKKEAKSVQNYTTSTELLPGNWNIVSVEGEKIVSEEPAFLSFDLTEKRMHGNNGCNVINGELAVSNDGSFKLDKVISTMKACMNNDSERLIMDALNKSVSFKIDSENNLRLYNADKKELILLEKQPLSKLEGTWSVVRINGRKLIENQKPSISFDTENLRISGDTGCNRMNGQITTDNSDKYFISLGQIATTRMACPGNLEAIFLKTLEAVKSFKILSDKDGKKYVALCNAQRKEIITLEK